MANGKKKKNKKKLFIFGGLGTLLLVIILLVVFSGNKEQIVSVQIEKAVKRDITQVVTATGTINPDFQVKISAEATGEIVQLNVKEGEQVKKGQLLLKIKPETYIAQKNKVEASLASVQATLNVYKADLEQADVNLKRVKSMYEKKLASDVELETAQSTYTTAKGTYESEKAALAQTQASLKEADENLNKTSVYAPMNGVVTSLKVELGERVLGSGYSSGTELLTVSDLSIMEATVDVDENDVVLVSVGDTSRVKIDAFSNKTFNGIVTEIGNSAASTTSSSSQDQVVNYEVKIRLIDKDNAIRPGMSCDARVETDTKKGVWSVPIQSVTARVENQNNQNQQQQSGNEPVVTDTRIKTNKTTAKSKEIVFIVKDNIAKIVDVEIGISDESYIEIKGGLKGDEDVVSGPYKAISKELTEGCKVMVQSSKKESGETKK